VTVTIVQPSSTATIGAGVGAIGASPVHSSANVKPTPSSFATWGSSVPHKSSGASSSSSSSATSPASPVYTGAAMASFTFSTGLLGSVALLVMGLVI
jgi:hypothetical protein